MPEPGLLSLDGLNAFRLLLLNPLLVPRLGGGPARLRDAGVCTETCANSHVCIHTCAFVCIWMCGEMKHLTDGALKTQENILKTLNSFMHMYAGCQMLFSMWTKKED